MLQLAPYVEVSIGPLYSSCFPRLLTWASRENGAGELYAYLPQNGSNTESLLAVPPRSVQHPDYGFSAGTGSFYFSPGRWIAVAQRVKMNTLGQANGRSFFAVVCVNRRYS